MNVVLKLIHWRVYYRGSCLVNFLKCAMKRKLRIQRFRLRSVIAIFIYCVAINRVRAKSTIASINRTSQNIIFSKERRTKSTVLCATIATANTCEFCDRMKCTYANLCSHVHIHPQTHMCRSFSMGYLMGLG